jgi:DNA polymerase-3 subunit epsilon
MFGDEAATPAQSKPADEPMPITDWLVDRLRQALDAEGLTSMAERQARIERAVGRPVLSLRALTYQEGLKVLSSIGEDTAGSGASKSAWDDRDEDTWIDRL